MHSSFYDEANENNWEVFANIGILFAFTYLIKFFTIQCDWSCLFIFAKILDIFY